MSRERIETAAATSQFNLNLVYCSTCEQTMDDEANKAFNGFLVFCYFGQKCGLYFEIDGDTCVPTLPNLKNYLCKSYIFTNCYTNITIIIIFLTNPVHWSAFAVSDVRVISSWKSKDLMMALWKKTKQWTMLFLVYLVLSISLRPIWSSTIWNTESRRTVSIRLN